MHNRHAWTEKTPEGVKREVRAIKFGGAWRIQSKLKDETSWTYHDEPSLEDLEMLRDTLFRKYQRRRAAYEDVELLDEMLKLRRADESADH